MAIQKEYDYLFRILLVGDSTVGKSALIYSFCDLIYTNPIMGYDFKQKTFCIKNGKRVKMQILDSPGQFRTTSTSCYRNVQGVILVYDVTNRQSFKNIKNWFLEVDERASENIEKMLIGNKSDLESSRQVNYEEGKTLADSLQIKFLEVSVKNNTNVEHVFMNFACQLKMKEENLKATPSQQEKLNNKQIEKSKCP